jgi:hypothetical protein
MSTHYDLSVSFRGWENISMEALQSELDARYGLVPSGGRRMTRAGERALLEITNGGTHELSFDAVSVEFKTECGWQQLVPHNWPWFAGWAWHPGRASTIRIPRPAEVPRDASWKIQFVCYEKGEAGDLRKARLETPEIPPIEKPNA